MSLCLIYSDIYYFPIYPPPLPPVLVTVTTPNIPGWVTSGRGWQGWVSWAPWWMWPRVITLGADHSLVSDCDNVWPDIMNAASVTRAEQVRLCHERVTSHALNMLHVSRVTSINIWFQFQSSFSANVSFIDEGVFTVSNVFKIYQFWVMSVQSGR